MVQPINPAELNGHNEQALTEIIYVKVANDVIGGQLALLENALTATSGILSTLQQLQNVKNQLHVSNRSVPTFDEGTYEDVASKVFGSSIKPSLISGYDYSQVSGLASTLNTQLQDLLTGLPASQQQQIQNDPNSIYNLGQKVLGDISAAGSPEAWVMDGYDTNDNQQGQYQNDLTLAITAGESLNDSKKEEVRRYLNIFEEYYKSASSILNKINEIIGTMARNISRQ